MKEIDFLEVVWLCFVRREMSSAVSEAVGWVPSSLTLVRLLDIEFESGEGGVLRRESGNSVVCVSLTVSSFVVEFSVGGLHLMHICNYSRRSLIDN